MSARLSAFVIWALVAGSAVYWLLAFSSRGPVAPSYTVPVADAAGLRGDLVRLLGGGPSAQVASAAPLPDAASQFKLIGIVAPRAHGPGGGGVAVIAVGDKPPRPFRVGASIDGQLMLRSVARRSASIGPASGGSGGFTLELPSPAEAATGSLPQVSMDSPQAYVGTAPGGAAPHGRPGDPSGYAPPGNMPPPGYAPPPYTPPQQPAMEEADMSPPPPPVPEAEQTMPELPEGAAPDGTPPPGEGMRPTD